MTRSRRPGAAIAAGCLVLLIGMGLRNSYAMFLVPVTDHLHWTREQFSLGLAIQLLVWGLVQPFAGAVADRYGTGRVVLLGGLSYTAGVGLSAQAMDPGAFHLSAGCMAGMGLGGAGFAVVLAAMSSAVAPQRRTFVMGVGTAAGSAGQFLLVPLSQLLIDARGWQAAYTLLAGAAALIVPAAYFLRGKPAPRAVLGEQTVVGALRQAAGHRPFRLLTCGYFVCGFQLAFITGHLPSYLNDKGLHSATGAAALSLVGLFNVFGCLWFGAQGDRRSKKLLLATIYLTRGLAIVAFVLTPLSVGTALAFAVVMGFTWLATVPLTTGLVAQMFGPRYLATLGGLVFCSHQVGSFLGVWLAGRIHDRTGSYLLVWGAAAALSFAAAGIHARLDDRPAEPGVRPVAQPGVTPTAV
jgi:MFS family permease